MSNALNRQNAAESKRGVVYVDAAEVGKALRTARKSLGVTQRDAAELAGMSERTVRDIERGRASASFSAYLDLADVVGATIQVTRAGSDGY